MELDGRQRVKSGQALTLAVPADVCYLFDAEGRAWSRHVGPQGPGVAQPCPPEGAQENSGTAQRFLVSAERTLAA